MINQEKLRHALKCVACGALIWLAWTLVTSLPAQAQTVNPSSLANQLGISDRATVVITQTVPLGATTSSLSISAGQFLTLSNRSLGIDQTASADLPSLGIVPLSYVNGSKTSDAIVTQANTDLVGQAPVLADQLRTYMSANSYQSAIFVYSHQLNVQGSPSIRQLVWAMSVLDNGKATWSAPVTLDADPYFVYMRYTPSSVSTALPAQWGSLVSQAGQMQWQLLKIKDGTAVTSLVSVPNYGVLDNLSSNPDMAPNCLADSAYTWTDSTGNVQVCPQGLTSAKTLILQYSASGGAIIDYVRQLTPVYAANGTAQVSVQVTERDLALTDCNNGTLTNLGNFGATLNEQIDRYQYSPSSPPATKISSVSAAVTPPTTTYTKTLVEQNQSKATLQGTIINPFATPSALVDSASVPQLVPPVPPLKVTLQNACAPFQITSSTINRVTGSPLQTTQGVLTCNGSQNQFTVNAGQDPNQCHGGSCNSGYLDMIATFTQGQADYFCSLTARNYRGYGYDDVCLVYDGANTVSFGFPTGVYSEVDTGITMQGCIMGYFCPTLHKFAGASPGQYLPESTALTQAYAWQNVTQCTGSYGANCTTTSEYLPVYTTISNGAYSSVTVPAIGISIYASLTFTGGWGSNQDITSNWATICPGN